MKSLLFVPGNRKKMLNKTLHLNPNILVPDLEDSIPDSEKTNARNMVASILPYLAEKGSPIIPRVNPLDSGLLKEDLIALVGPHIFGVSVGKTQSAQDIARIETLITEVEKTANLAFGTVRLVPWIETAVAVVNAYEICSASPRIVAVAFGAEDFARDMSIPRTNSNVESIYPRSVISVAAKAANVLALDTPFFRFHDPEGLKKDSTKAWNLGFKGKFAIHPSQIGIINDVFRPSSEEIEHAQNIVRVAEEAERLGKGSTSLNGSVIDIPVLKRARNLLELANNEQSNEQTGK